MAGDHLHDSQRTDERNTAPLRLRSALALVALLSVFAVSLAACASSSAHAVPIATPKPTAVKTSLRMNPVGDGLFCATQFAWSPDSTRIAVLGNGVNCSGASSGRTPGLILIYGRDGHLLQKLQPDTSVLAQPTIARKVAANSAAGGMISTLTYDSLTWAPDGQALLMTFDLELQATRMRGA